MILDLIKDKLTKMKDFIGSKVTFAIAKANPALTGTDLLYPLFLGIWTISNSLAPTSPPPPPSPPTFPFFLKTLLLPAWVSLEL